MQAFYFVLFLISAGYLVILLSKFQKYISVNYLMMSVAVIVECLGFMQMAGAKTTEGALMGNQVTCLATPFLLYFTVAVIAELCKVRIPKAVTAFCCGYGFFLFLCTCTVGHVDWYYRSVELIAGKGFSFLKKDYGVLHKLYPVYIAGMMCYGLGVSLTPVVKKKRVSYLVSSVCMALLLMCGLLYTGERMAGLKVELMPMAYVAAVGMILLVLNRVVSYDVDGISRESIAESRDYGFVICDDRCRFCSADEQAMFWFPELRELKIDRRIQSFSTDFLCQLKKWIQEGDGENVVLLEKEGHAFEICHSVPEKHRGHLHCIRIRDDTQQQRYLTLMKRYNEELAVQVKEKTARLEEVQNDIIVSMASIVENRNGSTGGHIRRTSDLVRVVSEQLERKGISPVSQEMAERIVRAAPLHDFGKIAIPDAVLDKPGRFTPEEYEVMKTHAQKGAEIVARILQNSDDLEFKRIAVNVAHYHHEKWDGTGYPCGLAGEAIPLEARVMALADVFDALVSKRVYKEPFGFDKAFSIIAESSGTHFDPALCSLFLQCRPEIEALYRSYTD